MKQTYLFEDQRLDPIVNVASVPQRSPFRYPGGKTWLVPRIRKWLKQYQQPPSLFIEPFAGGGIISLTVAFERLASHILMVELDKQVCAVWKTILEGDGEWLANQILTFQLTHENVLSILEQADSSIEITAFKTLLKNRIYHGGILAPGSGMIKYGENGKGLKSRWYPETLCKRIRDIISIRDRINFIEGDGITILRQYSDRSNMAFFIDPPYTAAGKKAGTRLYTCNELNHEELFDIVSHLKSDFLMTYDHCPYIENLSRKYGFTCLTVPMKNTHHSTMLELLIGRKLDWIHS